MSSREIGDRVRIKDGYYSGQTGTITAIDTFQAPIRYVVTMDNIDLDGLEDMNSYEYDELEAITQGA